jgi:hypothetical protein
MQPPAIKLDSTAAQVLKAIKDRGVVRGADLLRIARSAVPGAQDQDVLAAVRNLVKMEMVSLSGDCNSVDQFHEAYLTFLPSASAVADFAILEAM